ncbi:hypothetical protein CAP47_03750 [Psychroflexus sp. S27]|uniref:hypothetical protein n=1 Tax=Psychroflexus sp. S27 TaxID=1982757 RepID=UPI000C2988C0|nr:hypothetical protein [Psychroflexus sp. S27]PJX24607.1 hypothetical protein CAP47_03750 [Psychroflexus sp. S27]
MKNLLQFLLIIIISGCSSSNSLVNKEPYLYTLENPDGSKTKVKSHLTSQLSNVDYQTLKNHLNKISDKEIDFNKKIIINFIDNDPKIYRKGYQVPWDIFYGNIKDDLAKLGQSNHFWIINKKVKDLYYYHGDKIKWIVDEGDFIRKLFFHYNGLNGGFVIIKPNGDYFLKVGEYQKSEVLKTYKEF